MVRLIRLWSGYTCLDHLGKSFPFSCEQRVGNHIEKLPSEGAFFWLRLLHSQSLAENAQNVVFIFMANNGQSCMHLMKQIKILQYGNSSSALKKSKFWNWYKLYRFTWFLFFCTVYSTDLFSCLLSDGEEQKAPKDEVLSPRPLQILFSNFSGFKDFLRRCPYHFRNIFPAVRARCI